MVFWKWKWFLKFEKWFFDNENDFWNLKMLFWKWKWFEFEVFFFGTENDFLNLKNVFVENENDFWYADSVYDIVNNIWRIFVVVYD